MSEYAALARADWRPPLGCPYCQRALSWGDDCLSCEGCAVEFRPAAGVPSLLRREDEGAFSAFSQAYRDARLREGWGVLTPQQARELPFAALGGPGALYWAVRRETYRSLVRLLSRQGPDPDAGPVADLGAGIGWLGFRLAQAGYRVLGVDVSLDEAFGLQAARPYVGESQGRLALVQGDLQHPPLQEGRWSLVLYNASLHYASDLEATLRRAARALVPDGRLIVLDSPISRQPVPGTGRGDRHFGRQELRDALVSAGLRSRWLPVPRGPRWWVHRVKVTLKRDHAFGFPMVVAAQGAADPSGKEHPRAR